LKNSSRVRKWERSGRKVLEIHSKASAEQSSEKAEEDKDHEVLQNIKKIMNNENPKNARNAKC
jgi:hypothetical protein